MSDWKELIIVASVDFSLLSLAFVVPQKDCKWQLAYRPGVANFIACWMTARDSGRVVEKLRGFPALRLTDAYRRSFHGTLLEQYWSLFGFTCIICECLRILVYYLNDYLFNSGHVGFPSSWISRDVIIPTLRLMRVGESSERLSHHAWETIQQSTLTLLLLAAGSLAFAMPLRLRNTGLLPWSPRLSHMRATPTMLKVVLALCCVLQILWRVICTTPLSQGLIYAMKKLSGYVMELTVYLNHQIINLIAGIKS